MIYDPFFVDLLAEARTVVDRHRHATSKFRHDRTCTDTIRVPADRIGNLIGLALRMRTSLGPKWNLEHLQREVVIAIDEATTPDSPEKLIPNMRVPAQLVIDLIDEFMPNARPQPRDDRDESWAPTHRKKSGVRDVRLTTARYVRPGTYGSRVMPTSLTGRRRPMSGPEMQNIPVRSSKHDRPVSDLVRKRLPEGAKTAPGGRAMKHDRPHRVAVLRDGTRVREGSCLHEDAILGRYDAELNSRNEDWTVGTYWRGLDGKRYVIRNMDNQQLGMTMLNLFETAHLQAYSNLGKKGKWEKLAHPALWAMCDAFATREDSVRRSLAGLSMEGRRFVPCIGLDEIVQKYHDLMRRGEEEDMAQYANQPEYQVLADGSEALAGFEPGDLMTISAKRNSRDKTWTRTSTWCALNKDRYRITDMRNLQLGRTMIHLYGIAEQEARKIREAGDPEGAGVPPRIFWDDLVHPAVWAMADEYGRRNKGAMLRAVKGSTVPTLPKNCAPGVALHTVVKAFEVRAEKQAKQPETALSSPSTKEDVIVARNTSHEAVGKARIR